LNQPLSQPIDQQLNQLPTRLLGRPKSLQNIPLGVPRLFQLINGQHHIQQDILRRILLIQNQQHFLQGILYTIHRMSRMSRLHATLTQYLRCIQQQQSQHNILSRHMLLKIIIILTSIRIVMTSRGSHTQLLRFQKRPGQHLIRPEGQRRCLHHIQLRGHLQNLLQTLHLNLHRDPHSHRLHVLRTYQLLDQQQLQQVRLHQARLPLRVHLLAQNPL